MVCSTFSPINPVLLKTENGRPEVNHKDGIKYHNPVSNLEWVSQKHNSGHAVRMGLIKSGIGHKGSVTHIGKVVVRNKHYGKMIILSGRSEIVNLNPSHNRIKTSVKNGNQGYCGIQWYIGKSDIIENDVDLLETIRSDKAYMESNRLPYLASSNRLSFVVYGVVELKALGFSKINLFNHLAGSPKTYAGYVWSRIPHEVAEKYPRGIELFSIGGCK